MYNGFGLSTPRGTGTSGHIVKSNAVLSKDPIKERKVTVKREYSKALEEHEKMRKIEVQCYSLRKRLEKENKDEEEIEKLVKNLRESLSESGNKEKIPTNNK